MTRSRRLVERPPSDASRRPFKARHSKQACGFDRISADRRWTGSPHAVQREIDHLFDPRGRRCPPAKAAHCLAADATRPPSRASVLRRRIFLRERLAPTGNRAIPTDRILRLSKLFQSVIGRPRGVGSALVSSLGRCRSCYTLYADLSRTIWEHGPRSAGRRRTDSSRLHSLYAPMPGAC